MSPNERVRTQESTSPAKAYSFEGRRRLQGGVAEALETLLGIEKAQRLAEDVTGTRMACTAVLDVLFDARDWPGINEHVILLSKRRSQLKQACSLLQSTAPHDVEGSRGKPMMLLEHFGYAL